MKANELRIGQKWTKVSGYKVGSIVEITGILYGDVEYLLREGVFNTSASNFSRQISDTKNWKMIESIDDNYEIF